jgi:hypothetical protein
MQDKAPPVSINCKSVVALCSKPKRLSYHFDNMHDLLEKLVLSLEKSGIYGTKWAKTATARS